MATKKGTEYKDLENLIVPVGDIPKTLVMAVYGKAGTGKTVFGSSFPKPILFLDIRERGTESISDVEGVDVLPVTTWEQADQAYWYLKSGKSKYKSVVVDHLSQLQALGMDSVRAENNMSADEIFTKRDWGKLSGMIQTWIYNMRQLWDEEINVCFIAHERTSTGEDDGDERIDPSVGPRLMPSAASFLNGAVSAIGNTFIREVEIGDKKKGTSETVIQFCMRVGPNPIYAAKIRRPMSAEGEIPDIIVNPTFEKVIRLSRGEALKRKVTKR